LPYKKKTRGGGINRNKTTLDHANIQFVEKKRMWIALGSYSLFVTSEECVEFHRHFAAQRLSASNKANFVYNSSEEPMGKNLN
jgi:hypothetical protein